MNLLNETRGNENGVVYVEGVFTDEIQARLTADAYKQDYPPLGYGTHLTVNGTAGGWEVRGSRYASCD